MDAAHAAATDMIGEENMNKLESGYA